MKKLSLNIKKIQGEIARLDLTYTEFAKRCDISRPLLYYTLSRKQGSFLTISKIANGMGVDPKDLLQ